LVRLHLGYNYVHQFAGKPEEMLVVSHNVVWIVEKALGAMGETHSKEIGVGALTASSFWMNNEVLDLQEAVQAKIPVRDLLRVKVV